MSARASGRSISEGERFDLDRLRGPAVWACIAVLSMSAALFAARSETGLRRISLALRGPESEEPARPPESIALAAILARAAALESETRRVADLAQSLATERNRLAARLEAIERSIDVTGAIPSGRGEGGGRSPPEAGQSASELRPRDAGAPAQSAPLPSAEPLPGRGNAPTASRDAASPAAESVLMRAEFGIDLGGETSIDALRALWARVKTQHGGLVEGLRPTISMREMGRAGATELRLILGPLGNAAAAARLCAALESMGRRCEPTGFDSQRQAALR